MSKNKGKQFNIEKRAILSRMVAKSNKAKEIGEILSMDPTSISRELKETALKLKKWKTMEHFVTVVFIKEVALLKRYVDLYHAARGAMVAKLYLNVGNMQNSLATRKTGSRLFAMVVLKKDIVH